MVPDDTLSTSERILSQRSVPEGAGVPHDAQSYAMELKPARRRTSRSRRRGAPSFAAASPLPGVAIDGSTSPSRQSSSTASSIELRPYVPGDAGAKLRSLPEDHQLSRAIALLSTYVAGRLLAAAQQLRAQQRRRRGSRSTVGAGAKTTLRVGRQTFAGTALLETTEVLFRGETRLRFRSRALPMSK